MNNRIASIARKMRARIQLKQAVTVLHNGSRIGNMQVTREQSQEGQDTEDICQECLVSYCDATYNIIYQLLVIANLYATTIIDQFVGAAPVFHI